MLRHLVHYLAKKTLQEVIGSINLVLLVLILLLS